MLVEVKDIKKLCNQLLQKLEDLEIDKIELNNDLYWNTLSDDRENMNKEPKIGVGSLVDDIESLNKILSNENPLTIIDFERIANVLIAIQEKMLKSGIAFY